MSLPNRVSRERPRGAAFRAQLAWPAGVRRSLHGELMSSGRCRGWSPGLPREASELGR